MKSIESMKSFINRIGLLYVKSLCKREYEKQKFIDINERPIEYGFVFKHLAKQWPKTVLDVGTGATALPHLMRNCGFLVTAIDNIRDYWPSGMINRHYHVIDDDITKSRMTETFDFITCVSVLEHIRDHTAAMRSMYKLLNPSGHLVLTFPYNENKYIGNVYALPGSSVKETLPFVTQAYSRKELSNWLADNGGEIVEQEYWQFFTGEFWTSGERVQPPFQVTKDDKHQLSCLVIRKVDKPSAGNAE
jgi:2-polyprenyl-3-methyl-5-hydroxy-6-metoxy-1,4-benzoquinol methylase